MGGVNLLEPKYGIKSSVVNISHVPQCASNVYYNCIHVSTNDREQVCDNHLP